MKLDYYQIKRWAWLIIIFTFLLAMCGSCSATYHLKRATVKDPSLSFIDTVQTVTALPGVRAELELDKLLTTGRSVTIEEVQIKTVWRDSVRYLEIECPPDSVITNYVPKIKFVTEELTTRQLVKRAKELGEVNKIRIAGPIIWGAVLFGVFIGVIFVIIIRLKFFV